MKVTETFLYQEEKGIKRQTEQLKAKYIELRNKYHSEKREASFHILEVQKKISAVQKKAKSLEKKLEELQAENKHAEKERISNEIIESIWSVLKDYKMSEDEYVPTPILKIPDTPINEGSIAQRRTRRSNAGNVYYKEPSLRGALTPGDPYTFSLEDGIITPKKPHIIDGDTPKRLKKR